MREHAGSSRPARRWKDAGRGRLAGSFDIRVIKNNIGGFAAEFERHPFEVAAAPRDAAVTPSDPMNVTLSTSG
jgi:hypothetical protein